MGGETLLRHVTELDLDEYRSDVLRRPKSPTTKRRISMATAKNRLDAVKGTVRDAMEHVFPLRVPLKVDVRHGANWTEAH